MKVMCVGVGKGHDSQPDTVRVSFEDVLPPYATALTLTVPRSELSNYLYGTLYNINVEAIPPVVEPAVTFKTNPNALVDPTEEVINAS